VTAATIARLEAHFSQAPEVLRGAPATEEAIKAAETRLKCRFDADYVQFLRMFGCGMVGADPVFGIGTAEALGADEDVVTQTERYRAQRWPRVQGWYVASADARGNPIGIGDDGVVRMSDHDVGDVSVLTTSFEAFLMKCLRG
jgi:hypothetical protein